MIREIVTCHLYFLIFYFLRSYQLPYILITESKVSDPDNRLKIIYVGIISDEVISEVLIGQLFHSVLLYETRNSE